eukprot:g26040.t1
MLALAEKACGCVITRRLVERLICWLGEWVSSPGGWSIAWFVDWARVRVGVSSPGGWSIAWFCWLGDSATPSQGLEDKTPTPNRGSPGNFGCVVWNGAVCGK